MEQGRAWSRGELGTEEYDVEAGREKGELEAWVPKAKVGKAHGKGRVRRRKQKQNQQGQEGSRLRSRSGKSIISITITIHHLLT